MFENISAENGISKLKKFNDNELKTSSNNCNKCAKFDKLSVKT